MFLHGGRPHILGNLWTLWIFGDNVEDRMGPARFLAFYLFTGLAAGLTHWFTNLDSAVPTVGASGAIAGVLGAYFVLFPRSRIIVLVPVFFLPLFFQLPAVIYLLFWLLSQIMGGAISGLTASEVGGVAWWAHVGGFATGMVTQWFFRSSEDKARRAFQRDEYGVERAWAQGS
jgi:membrane associated rhomboid family serine protease